MTKQTVPFGMPFLNPVTLRSLTGIFVVSVFIMHFLFALIWLAISAIRVSVISLLTGEAQAYFIAIPVFTICIVIVLLCGRLLLDILSFFKQCRLNKECFEVNALLSGSDRIIAFVILLLSSIPIGIFILSGLQWLKKDGVGIVGIMEYGVVSFLGLIFIFIPLSWIFWLLPERWGWRRLDFVLSPWLEKLLWGFVIVGAGLVTAFLSSVF